MSTVEITLKVPESYVQDAEDFGMLDPNTLVDVLRNELDRRIMAFVNAEVKAYRAEEYAKQQKGQADE